MLEELTPAKFKHQLVIKAQRPAAVDVPCGVGQAEQAVCEIGRQPRHSAVKRIAALSVSGRFNRCQALLAS